MDMNDASESENVFIAGQYLNEALLFTGTVTVGNGKKYLQELKWVPK